MRECHDGDENLNRLFKLGLHKDISASNAEAGMAMMDMLQGANDLLGLATIKPGHRSSSHSVKDVKNRIGLMVEGQKRFLKYHIGRIELFRCCVDAMSGQVGHTTQSKIREIKEGIDGVSNILDGLVATLDTAGHPNEVKRKAIDARDAITKTVPELGKSIREVESVLNERANDIISTALTDKDELTVRLAIMFNEPTRISDVDSLR